MNKNYIYNIPIICIKYINYTIKITFNTIAVFVYILNFERIESKKKNNNNRIYYINVR